MTQLAEPRVALLDANALFPFRKRDILLRFHHAGLFGTFDPYPSEALGVLCILRKVYSNPTFTPSEFVCDLAAKRLTRLAARMRERRENLQGKASRRR